ncbi:uncharacterized protein PHALS_00009 [Plasmopara halstedii]|uniref:Uncharacterized protein n=1 Tax=Plasmopara halstedii TaxID=4781 RepID=A0A0P1AT09_PLAHL|nr:uncharacterized protein PHALS_00009 [Plasmopara halstedii]CEG44247.1 hypothetical protein PHALS_00009 [Plasmopara halstedii]|eukprot:XP_024580616.1 hypothetical protein PHALS_00009 [Plasmopara halstedii]
MGCCTPRAEEALTLCVCVTVNSSTRYSSTPDYSEYIFMVSALVLLGCALYLMYNMSCACT